MYGAEAVILNLSRALNGQGHTAIVAAFANADLRILEAARRQGIEAHPIPCRGPSTEPSPPPSAISRSRSGQTSSTPTAIRPTCTPSWPSAVPPRPLVSTCHTWYDNDLAVRLYGALDRLVLRRFAAVAAVSEEVRRRLLDAGVPPTRIHLIRNGIDLTPFTAARPPHPPGSPLTVGLVGRLAPEKGVDLFLQAAAQVHAQLPNTRFLVVGDGPDRPDLEALIRQLGLQDTATLLGRRDDMPAFYASLDLLVSASRQEGLPIALLEGMAAALPLVATAVGAVPTLIQHDRNGLLVPPPRPVRRRPRPHPGHPRPPPRPHPPPPPRHRR